MPKINFSQDYLQLPPNAFEITFPQFSLNHPSILPPLPPSSSDPLVIAPLILPKNRRKPLYNNNMSQLIIRQSIIFLDAQIQCRPSLSLKLAHGAQIYRFPDFRWSAACNRWQRAEQLKIPWPECEEIGLEVYFQEGKEVPVVIGEGSFSMATVMAHLGKEIRIVLMYDGNYVGCLYCEVSNCRDQDSSLSRHFIYIHKVEMRFLEDLRHSFRFRVSRNEGSVFEKEFALHNREKSFFPNIKIAVKMSDVFRFSLVHQQVEIREVRFQVQHIRRGKTSIFDVWLRNQLKNKMADMRVEYFLENIFLENERQIFTRNGICGKKLLTPLTPNEEREKLRRSVIIRQIMEADQRFLKIDHSMHKLIKKIEASQRKDTLEMAIKGDRQRLKKRSSSKEKARPKG